MSEQSPEEIAAASPAEELGDTHAVEEVSDDDLEDGEETRCNTMNEPSPEDLPQDGEDPDLPEGSYDEFDGSVEDESEADGVAQPDDPFATQQEV